MYHLLMSCVLLYYETYFGTQSLYFVSTRCALEFELWPEELASFFYACVVAEHSPPEEKQEKSSSI